MFRHIFRNNKGFTLIELLIVIGVIATLATSIVLLINPLGQMQRSRDAQRKSDLRQIQSALEMYRSDNGNYPASLPSCGNPFTNADASTTYLSKIPCDPTWSGGYTYTPGSPAVSYKLTACLENAIDPQRDTSPETVCNATGRIITVQNP